jgi:hypothetical protein
MPSQEEWAEITFLAHSSFPPTSGLPIVTPLFPLSFCFFPCPDLGGRKPQGSVTIGPRNSVSWEPVEMELREELWQPDFESLLCGF